MEKYRTFNKALAHLSKATFPAVFKLAIKLPAHNLVASLHAKAIVSPLHACLCAKLCSAICIRKSEKAFCTLLLAKFRNTFINTAHDSTKKHNFLCNIKFFGELCKQHIFSTNSIHKMISKLFKSVFLENGICFEAMFILSRYVEIFDNVLLVKWNEIQSHLAPWGKFLAKSALPFIPNLESLTSQLKSIHLQEGSYDSKKIVILMGPPLSGKTSFAQTWKSQEPGIKVFYLGEIIRSRGFDKFPAHFFQKEYYSWIVEALEKFKKAPKSILVLDAIKDVQDAEQVLEISQQALIPIDHVILFKTYNLSPFPFRGRNYPTEVEINRHHKYASNYLSLLSFYAKNAIPVYTTPTMPPITSNHQKNNIQLQKATIEHLEPFAQFLPDIYHHLIYLLGTSKFEPSHPSSFVQTQQHFTWVRNPANYFVSHKVDGVRNILIILQEGSYLMERSKNMKLVKAMCGMQGPSQPLPPYTVLDGELICLSGQQLFVTFDLLCLQGIPTWDEPFASRQSKLKSVLSLSSCPLPQSFHPSQCLWVVAKEYHHSTVENIESLLYTSAWYPEDGLIFTHSMRYVFGTDMMLFKWQPIEKIRCEVLASMVSQLSNTIFPHKSFRCNNTTEVATFRWRAGCWELHGFRTDKMTGNSLETVQELTNICRQPFSLQKAINQPFFSKLKVEMTTEQQDCQTVRITSFDSLLQNALLLEQEGLITHFSDFELGLDIFNYKIQNEQTKIFRGLVLHLPSKTVVATPFTDFCEYEDAFVDPDEWVEVMEKIDGSLGIGFVWNGQIYVSTRKRLNSEQAIWATTWIRKNANTAAMQEGWTYLFEIVYPDNRVIIDYPYAGLVLLSCVTPEGEELGYGGLLALAERLNSGEKRNNSAKVRVPFRFCCRFADAVPQLQHLIGDDLRCEGGIIKRQNGERVKFVSDAWKNAYGSALEIHPQIVWRYMRYRQLHSLLEKLPLYLHDEVHSIALALDTQFRKLAPLFVSKNEKQLIGLDTGVNLPNKEIQEQALEFILYWRLDENAKKSSWKQKGAWDLSLDIHQQIMNAIRPHSLTIEGYFPSSHFMQTFAKAWQEIPANFSRVPQNYEGILFSIPREILIHILSYTPLGKSSIVCHHFWKLIVQNVELNAQKYEQILVCQQDREKDRESEMEEQRWSLSYNSRSRRRGSRGSERRYYYYGV